jgi:general stress protein 26
MPSEAEITTKFWKALKSDKTVMLGLAGVPEGHYQPMMAQLEGDARQGPIWFFTAKDVTLVRAMGHSHAAAVQFASKGHDLFASMQGMLAVDNDRVVINRLWNRFVAAWYPGGQNDPNLQLLRFDASQAQVWLSENSLFAGMKIMMGGRPRGGVWG